MSWKSLLKNESNEVVGHVLLAEITLTSQNDKQTALAIGALSVNSEVREQGLGKSADSSGRGTR